MNKLMTLLLCDTYKQTHVRQLPKNTTRLVSYWTPRKSMSKKYDKMVFFGLQAFIKQFLIEDFNINFFSRPLREVLSEYKYYMDIQLGEGNYDTKHIEKLHKVGYLPLCIKALPEGSLVNMGIPCIEITNTLPEFAWLVQWIECILQTQLWPTCAYATVGKIYKTIADEYYELTSDQNSKMAMADFGMRGMSCIEDAIRTSASWLLSFDKTSTIPALQYIQKYYNADKSIGVGGVSTEHSVQCSNFAVDGDEVTFVKRMLIDLYPNTSFSIVADTYDYWNFVDNVLPSCKKEIMEHNGKMFVRPDSGDLVEISVKTIEKLWDMFGGEINSKGFKVLDPHIGVILGDGCTTIKVEKIYKKLMDLGFAANNIYFGVGAFCFHALFEEENNFTVITRDLFGIAMKSTYLETSNFHKTNKYHIQKNPKTDDENLKKSHKGCCIVRRTDNGYLCEDGNDFIADSRKSFGLSFIDNLKTVFDGSNYVSSYQTDFADIRKRLDTEKL